MQRGTSLNEFCRKQSASLLFVFCEAQKEVSYFVIWVGVYVSECVRVYVES